MPTAIELLERAAHYRHLARRARENADYLEPILGGKVGVGRHIADLEAQALALEKQAAALAPPTHR
jgi:hypothetical protein